MAVFWSSLCPSAQIDAISMAESSRFQIATCAIEPLKAVSNVAPILTVPDPRQRALLADAGFVLKPDFEGFGLGLLGKAFEDKLEEVFFKASWASGSLFGCCGRTDKRR